MASIDFDRFTSDLVGRHPNSVTSRLSTAGDVLWLASVPLGFTTRSLRVFGGVFLAGTVVATGAHMFQAGTVAEELAQVLRHPIWAARAEWGRVFGR